MHAFINNPGVNSDEMTLWKEKFERWVNEAEYLTQTKVIMHRYRLRIIILLK